MNDALLDARVLQAHAFRCSSELGSLSILVAKSGRCPHIDHDLTIDFEEKKTRSPTDSV